MVSYKATMVYDIPPYQPPTEPDISASILPPATTPDVIAQCYEQHARYLTGIAIGMASGQRQDAEDLVQQATLQALRTTSPCKPGTNVKSWMGKIVHNVGIDEFHRQRRRPVTDGGEIFDIAENKVPAALSDTMPGERIEQVEYFEALERHINPKFLTAVEAHDIVGMDYEEIAAATGVPLGTVRSRIHRGRTAIRQLYEQGVEGFELPAHYQNPSERK